MSKKVIVTGGAGYLGSHLVNLFLSRGDEVIVIDDLSNSSARALRMLRAKYNLFESNSGRLKCYYTSINERDELDRVIRMHSDAALTVHCASCKGWNVDNKFHYFNTLEATRNLMYSLKEYSKCKDVIFISTSQVHHSDLDKTDNQYAIAKLEAEEFLRNFTKYNKDYRISTIRPSNIIGSIEPLGDDPKDSVSLPTMLARISVGRREYDGMIYVYSSETTKDSSFERDYIHMSDVVKAIKIVVNRIETSDSLDSYSTYELNSGERASVLDLVEKYWEESRKFRTRVEMIGPRCGDGDLPETLPSTLLLESLGWVRSKSLLDGIQDSYLFYKNNPMGYRDEMITQWRR